MHLVALREQELGEVRAVLAGDAGDERLPLATGLYQGAIRLLHARARDGGGGFLGSHLVERLRAEGLDPFVARRRTTTSRARDAERLFADARPELVFHLAAEVGGIGANRANPGRYWYANLVMGAHVLEQARPHGVGKLVLLGTICAYPKFAPVPFREEELWNGYPEETNAPYGIAKKALLVGAQAYREQYGLNAIYLLPVNLYGPGDNFDLETSHVIPALIRKMVEAHERGDEEIVVWGDGSADARVPLRRRLRRGSLARRATLRRSRSRQPRHRRRDHDPRSGRAHRELTGFQGQIVWDTAKPNGQPRRALDVSRAESYSVSGPDGPARWARADDRLVSRRRARAAAVTLLGSTGQSGATRRRTRLRQPRAKRRPALRANQARVDSR